MKGQSKKGTVGNPLITIITVVKNSAPTLKSSLESVLRQNYKNIEYLAFDGGSTDGSVEILEEFSDRLDYWYSGPDGGVFDAMNKAVKSANGDWVYFLGADDILMNVIHILVPFLRSQDQIYYGDVTTQQKAIRHKGAYNLLDFMRKNICHQAIFYPKKVFQTYEFQLKYDIVSDFDLNMRCWGDKAFAFSYVPLLICDYTGTGRSTKLRDYDFERDKSMLRLTLVRNVIAKRINRLIGRCLSLIAKPF